MTGSIILAVAQQKGGAGKTTLVAHLAVEWARVGLPVAVVDIDPQQSLYTWFRHRVERGGDVPGALTVGQVSGWRTQAEVERLARSHAVVLIDSPPHAETEARLAVRAADLVLVPIQPSPMDVWASRPTIDLARAEGTPVLAVLNRTPPRANLTDAMLAEVARLDAPLAEGRIGSRVLFASAMAEGLTAGEVQPRSAAAREIGALAAEVLAAAGASKQG